MIKYEFEVDKHIYDNITNYLLLKGYKRRKCLF